MDTDILLAEAEQELPLFQDLMESLPDFAVDDPSNRATDDAAAAAAIPQPPLVPQFPAAAAAGPPQAEPTVPAAPAAPVAAPVVAEQPAAAAPTAQGPAPTELPEQAMANARAAKGLPAPEPLPTAEVLNRFMVILDRREKMGMAHVSPADWAFCETVYNRFRVAFKEQLTDAQHALFAGAAEHMNLTEHIKDLFQKGLASAGLYAATAAQENIFLEENEEELNRANKVVRFHPYGPPRNRIMLLKEEIAKYGGKQQQPQQQQQQQHQGKGGKGGTGRPSGKEVPRVSEETKAMRAKSGLCIKCGGKGHKAAVCRTGWRA